MALVTWLLLITAFLTNVENGNTTVFEAPEKRHPNKPDVRLQLFKPNINVSLLSETPSKNNSSQDYSEDDTYSGDHILLNNDNYSDDNDYDDGADGSSNTEDYGYDDDSDGGDFNQNGTDNEKHKFRLESEISTEEYSSAEYEETETDSITSETPAESNKYLKIPSPVLYSNKQQHTDVTEETVSNTNDSSETTSETPYFIGTEQETPATEIDTEISTETTDESIVANIFDRETLPKCPEELNYYENELGIPVCYTITTPSTFPPPCPFPNNIEYFFIKNKYALEITQEPIWTFATKNTTNGSGFFEWTNYIEVQDMENYISKESFDISQKDITNKDCLIFDNNKLVPKSCAEKYPGICVYSYNSSYPSFNNYCARRYNSSCISSDLGSPTKCFCLSDVHLYGRQRNSFCGKLANIINPYENALLTTYLSLENPCWIGLDKDKVVNQLFRWSSTNTVSNYTYFSDEANFNYIYGALQYDGWTLHEDGALNCAICEINVNDHPKVELHLNYNQTANAIELEILNTLEAYQGVICFEDNNANFVNLTANNNSKIVLWTPSVNAKYWCKTWQIPDLNLVYSNTIFSNNLNMSSKSTDVSGRRTCSPSVTVSGDISLHWPETGFGVTAIPEELCLQQDGSPVTRSCGGTFTFKSNWLPVNGTCADVTFSPRTLELNTLLQSPAESTDLVTSNLLHITEDQNNVTSFQIHLMSKVFSQLASGTEDFDVMEVKNVVETVSNIMHYQPGTLRGSQELLNSTDIILCSLDDILLRTDLSQIGFISAISEKLLIQMSNLQKSSITGIKLSPLDRNGFDPSKVEPVQKDTPQASVIQGNPELAVLTPQQLYNDITNCMGSRISPNIITGVFYDDTLFNEKDNVTGRPEGRVVSIVIPGFNCSFTAPVQVFFKIPSNYTKEVKCASWVYGSNDELQNIYGHWSIEDDPKQVDSSTYLMCEFHHATHFSLLVLGDNTNISEGHKKALDIITAVGSGLSLLGLLVIFVTAIIFKSYRSANGVVINFSLAMTAQIVLLFIADNVADDQVLCTVFGAALHYIVLSQFFWMLTIALLQYQRYVQVFSTPPTHLVAKSCAFSWGIPLLPVIVIVSISTDNYGPNSYGLCYALGNYFIFGLLLPVSLIAFINLLVFLRIMISIASSRRITVHQTRDDTTSLQLRLAFMLYFLLGLTWGFGLLAAIGGGVVYSYLFCLTATLQGFVMFIFFIVLNERTRSLWINMKSCCRKGEYDIGADSAGTAMMRRAKTTASSDTCTDSTSSDMLRRYKNRSSSDF